nr:MAG: hypothetical protein [Microvirus sp.]
MTKLTDDQRTILGIQEWQSRDNPLGSQNVERNYEWPDEEKCPEKNPADPSKKELELTIEIEALRKEVALPYRKLYRENRELRHIIYNIKMELLTLRQAVKLKASQIDLL